MNGYKAFFRGKTCDVYAESSYRAQLKAAIHFKAKRPYDVSVVLCELGVGQNGQPGTQVTHSTADI